MKYCFECGPNSRIYVNLPSNVIWHIGLIDFSVLCFTSFRDYFSRITMDKPAVRVHKWVKQRKGKVDMRERKNNYFMNSVMKGNNKRNIYPSSKRPPNI